MNKKISISRRRMLAIPFTEKEYYVTRNGEFISNANGNMEKLEGKKIDKNGERRCLDVKIKNDSKRHSLQINRVVFFCFIYPSILDKKLEDMTWDDYREMPSVLHIDGNLKNNMPKNLSLCQSKSKLGKWILKNFPDLLKHELLKKQKSTITGKDLVLAKKLLSKGVSYPKIATSLSIKISSQAVWRLNRRLQISTGRPNGKAKLSKEDIIEIKKLIEEKKFTGVQLAKKYGVSETTISRIPR